MEQTKITAKIYTSHFHRFESDIRERFLKRDAFLNQILSNETDYLEAEMEGKSLSTAAHKYIAGELKRMGTTPVNIVVDKVIADKLNAVVKNTNMVRDAFLNYLLLCLRSSDNFLKYFDLPLDTSSSRFNAIVFPLPLSPLAAIREVNRDPFYFLRQAVSERHGTGLYTMTLPKQYHGFSCYMSDEDVPGTEAFDEQQRFWDELEELTQRDKDAFSTAVGGEK